MMQGGLLWAALTAWLWGGSAALFDLGRDVEIPSLTPYSDVDLAQTLSFTRRPGRPWIKRKPQRLVVTAYTDVPECWPKLRFQAVVQLARWYLARCRIELPKLRLRRLPPGTLTDKGIVRWKLSRKLQRTRDPNETFLLFSKDVRYRWGRPPRLFRLLGVSAKIWLPVGKQRWQRYPAVWVRPSPIFTTLVHELGHRLGLVHVKRPYRLMITGTGVRSSLETLWTSMLGFFAPKRFVFTPGECLIMHQTLLRERRQRPMSKVRLLGPIKLLRRRQQ